MKMLLVLALVLGFVGVAEAKPKTQNYKDSPEKVFQAAMKAAREHHVITFMDEKNLTFGFESDGNGGSQLVVNVQKTRGQTVAFGAGDRMAEKFFGFVTENLARQS